jgi:hypothetical protein
MTFPKPTKRKAIKARQDRHEAAVIKAVRAACVERDGYCRVRQSHHYDKILLDLDLLECAGSSQFTHLPPKTRAATRNMAPEERHGTAWTIQACRRHHDMIDGRQRPRIVVRCLTPDGADGPIAVEVA